MSGTPIAIDMERPGGNWMNRVGLLLALAILAAAPAAAHAKTLRCRTFLPKSSGVWVGKITAHNVGCSYADGLAVVIALQPPGYALPSTIHAGNGAWQVHSSRARS